MCVEVWDSLEGVQTAYARGGGGSMLHRWGSEPIGVIS
jgi:hypothetical protein